MHKVATNIEGQQSDYFRSAYWMATAQNLTLDGDYKVAIARDSIYIWNKIFIKVSGW